MADDISKYLGKTFMVDPDTRELYGTIEGAPLDRTMAFDTATFRGGSDLYTEFQGSDLETFYGLLDDSDMLDSKATGREHAAYQTKILAEMSADRLGFGHEHRGGLANLLWENAPVALLGTGSDLEGDIRAGGDTGVGYLFQMPFFANSSIKGSVALGRALETSKNERELLRSNPGEFLAAHSQNLDKYAAIKFASFGRIIANDFYTIAHNDAVKAIGINGVAKTLADNIGTAWSQGDLQIKEAKKLEREVLSGLGENPSQEAVGKALLERKADFQTIARNRNNAASIREPLTDSFITMARQYLPEPEKKVRKKA